MTINDYLKSSIGGSVLTDAQVEVAILNVGGIVSGADVSDVDPRLRELSLAEVLWIASRMVGGGSYSKKVNNRSISESVGVLTDGQRKSFANEANAIRAKYGLPAYTVSDSIKDVSNLWL